MSIDYLVFLESFQISKWSFGDVSTLILVLIISWCILFFDFYFLSFNKVNLVSVNDSTVLTFDSKVVGDKFDRSFGRGCHPGPSWATELWFISSIPLILIIIILSLMVLSSLIHWTIWNYEKTRYKINKRDRWYCLCNQSFQKNRASIYYLP